MSGPPPRMSRRPWLRLSVRAMLVLVLMIGGGLGWLVRTPGTRPKPSGHSRDLTAMSAMTGSPKTRTSSLTMSRPGLRNGLWIASVWITSATSSTSESGLQRMKHSLPRVDSLGLSNYTSGRNPISRTPDW